MVYEALSDIGAQDVVEFRDEKLQALYEYTLGAAVKKGERVTARYKKGVKLSVGNLLYRTRNQALLLETEERYVEKKDQLPVSGIFRAQKGKRVSLVVKCREYQAEVSGDVCESAKNQPSSEEMIRRTLTKTGESTCFFESLDIFLENGLFFSVGKLKELRRKAFQRLERRILEETEREKIRENLRNPIAFLQAGARKPGKGTDWENTELAFSASVMDLAQLKEVLLRGGIDRVYLQTEKLENSMLKEAFFRIKEAGKRPFLAFPMIFRNGVEKLFRRDLEKEIGSLPWEGVLLKNLESLLFTKDFFKQRDLEIVLDAGLYIMNERAYRFYKERASLLTLPYELTWEEMKGASFVSACELIGYGRVPLMVSAQCVQANTEYCAFTEKGKWGRRISFLDERNRKFSSVNFCKYCYNVIYQETPVFLREVLEDRRRYPVRSFRYAFTTESGKEVREVLEGHPPFRTQAGHFYKGIE